MTIIKIFTIGRLSIAVFNTWLGFSYRNFIGAKRLDIGYLKFWYDGK